MNDAHRYKVGVIDIAVSAGQPLFYADDGTLHRTEGRPNCVALEAIEFEAGVHEKPCKILLLQAGPRPGEAKQCICGHPASLHRSSDDHCNAPGCNCIFPSCGH